MVRVMEFNATINNISVISWRSILLLEETRGPGETQHPVISHWQTLSHNVVHLALITDLSQVTDKLYHIMLYTSLALITNNSSFILWRLVLLVEEPGGNHRPVVSHWQTLSHNFVSSTPRLLWIRTHNVSASNYTSIIMLRAKWWNSDINYIVFGLARPRIKSAICHTRGNHANHCTTDELQN